MGPTDANHLATDASDPPDHLATDASDPPHHRTDGTLDPPDHPADGTLDPPDHPADGTLDPPNHQTDGTLHPPHHQTTGTLHPPNHQTTGTLHPPNHQTTGAFDPPHHQTTGAFNLPDRLSAKADPALIAQDERHFAAVAECLRQTIAELSERLDAELKAPGGTGQQAMDRDIEVHRLGGRLRTLRRFGLDLCLGHMVRAGDPEPVYVGRLGLTDGEGRRLLIDWRSPAAEPFFAATHARPMGLVSRRRYRWTEGRISDYWDEVFDADGLEGRAALDDQSAFIASLGAGRSARMRDVLATIAADQDAVIRAGSRGALVVDGGPGTGKTVVALHRTAHLLYSDPRLGHRRGGVLFVGPHRPYLAYVSDVLPSLGEEGVQTCLLRDLVPEGATAGVESEPEVARLKASADMVKAIEKAVAFYEEPPTEPLTVTVDWSDLVLTADDWAEAFESPEPGTPHNEARDQVWEKLVAILRDKYDGDVPPDRFARALRQDEELDAALGRAWPLLEAADLVGDLWSVPAYLRLCAPWLTPEEVRRLQRADPQAWTVSDLPLLDAARQRLGDPRASRRRRRREAEAAAERAYRAQVTENLLRTDDDWQRMLMTMLTGQDLQNTLIDTDAPPTAEPDLLAGPFAHIVVDEAQELTDAEWQMLLLRCPSRSFTIVGDRAQARHGFTESWRERLERIGLDRITLASLTLNYRTPQEIMTQAEPVIRAVLPDANVPTSIRSTGVPVTHGSTADLDTTVDTWLATHAEGTACVIGAPAFRARPRVQSLTPELSKGLEFDLVVLVDPERFGAGIEGAVDRYVAMTRATQRLVVLTSS
ncbi:RNA polymerase recycling motor ATPase HelR [Streptomyces sp. 7R007]